MRDLVKGARSLQRVIVIGLLICSLAAVVASQQPQRSPSDTVREFYKAMRERKFREAFDLSIYRPAIDPLKPQEFEDLRPDFERIALAVSEKIPGEVKITGEQISGDDATVFIKILDAEAKEQLEPTTLIKLNGGWVVGDRDSLQLVKKAGKEFFFNARIDAHHSDVQDMLTRVRPGSIILAHDGGIPDRTKTLRTLPMLLAGLRERGFKMVDVTQLLKAAQHVNR